MERSAIRIIDPETSHYRNEKCLMQMQSVSYCLECFDARLGAMVPGGRRQTDLHSDVKACELKLWALYLGRHARAQDTLPTSRRLMTSSHPFRRHQSKQSPESNHVAAMYPVSQ
jgi:hypothetical protein